MTARMEVEATMQPRSAFQFDLRYTVTAGLAWIPFALVAHRLIYLAAGAQSWQLSPLTVLSIGLESVLIAQLLRPLIAGESPRVLLAGVTYFVLAAALLAPVLFAVQSGYANVFSGGPQPWGELGSTLVHALVVGTKTALLMGLLVSPLGVPYACLVVWLLRRAVQRA